MHRCIGGLWLLAVACLIPAHLLAGNIELLDIFKNQVFTQISGTAPTSPTGFFANVELTSVDPGDFDGVSVSYPGPASPVDLSMFSPTFFGYAPSFSTLADMNAAIPFGSYDYTATNSVTMDTETATLDYEADAFASEIPALTSATWDALSGLDPSTALDVGFDSFTPAANTSPGNGYAFFSVDDTSGNTVFTDGFLDPSSTSLLLPADTLLPDTTYSFELDFSDRQLGTDPATGVSTLIGSDLRDDGSFTTGAIAVAPESGTVLLLVSGLVGFAALRKRLA